MYAVSVRVDAPCGIDTLVVEVAGGVAGAGAAGEDEPLHPAATNETAIERAIRSRESMLSVLSKPCQTTHDDDNSPRVGDRCTAIMEIELASG